MKRNYVRLIIAALATVLVAVPSAANASAGPVSASTAQVSVATGAIALSEPRHVIALSAALDAGGVPSHPSVLRGTVRTTYILPSGSTIVVERPRVTSGAVSPQFSIGVGWGTYIYLNRTDQQVVAAGGAAGLAVLICASTTVIGCAAVSAALAGAATWIATRGGICASRLEIRHFLGVYTFKCVNP